MTPPDLFALLSDQTRLRSLNLLLRAEELCVCELVEVLGSGQPKISRHLALMRKSGLVSDERRGQWVYYRVNGELEDWVQKTLQGVAAQLKEMEPYRSDYLALVKLRKQGCC